MGKRKVVLSDSDDASGSVGNIGNQSFASTHNVLTKTLSGRQPIKKKTKHVSDLSMAKGHPKDTPKPGNVAPSHPISTHIIESPGPIRVALLHWYTGVQASRGMPWRKPYDPSSGPEERAQRAYEVWVSEIMLQQTQVSTVVPYYNRWMEKFPTIRELAASSLDQVNALWKGLGYYTRASRLLSGAQKAVQEYGGRLPDNAKDMEANIPGIGRYSAGAICSIAYGERVPVLDGNVHRLMSRLLALYAPPKAKATLDILWAAATDMVREIEPSNEQNSTVSRANSEVSGIRVEYPGDINQALIELGSTVCKVRDPNCEACPLRNWCVAYARKKGKDKELDSPVHDIEDMCSLCDPLPEDNGVTAYPMKVERKKAREELDVVNVIEWRSKTDPNERWFLLVRRPDGGLLAGLHEFPTLADVSSSTLAARLTRIPETLLSTMLQRPLCPYQPSGASSETSRTKTDVGSMTDHATRITKIQPAGDVIHVFSHIKKTYRVQWVLLEGGDAPPQLVAGANALQKGKGNITRKREITKGKRKHGKEVAEDTHVDLQSSLVNAMWISLDEVADANIGTGVMKVWNLVMKLWKGR